MDGRGLSLELFFFANNQLFGAVERTIEEKHGEWLKSKAKPNPNIFVYGEWKLKKNPKTGKARRARVSAEIDHNHSELISLIVEHSKYPLDWILGLGIVEFYTHVRLIEKELKRKAKK